MSTFVIGMLCGAPVGAALVVVAGALRGKAALKVVEEAEPLTDDDREVIYSQFTIHADAVRQQVSQFADTLAGDDVLLRERLRRFEKGGDS